MSKSRHSWGILVTASEASDEAEDKYMPYSSKLMFHLLSTLVSV